MAIEIIRDGTVVRRSRNLRGLLRYLGKVPCESVRVTETPDGGADLVFAFSDGAQCRTDFASFTVAKGWLSARRTLKGVPVHFYPHAAPIEVEPPRGWEHAEA